jgi:4'-phosphopantetheinyl transferase
VDASSIVEVRYLPLLDPLPAGQMTRWLEILSAGERQRAERFGGEADRISYVAAHALLRESLSRRVDLPPERWAFRPGPRGKPEIGGAEGSLGLAVSLSHTRGFAVCAVSDGGQVGVDVEHAHRKPPLRISESCFAPAERRALDGLPESDRPGRFFEYWTLKEALLKAIGLGLAYPLDRLSFELGAGGPRIHLPDDLGESSDDWLFRSWLVSGGFRIALAARTDGSVREVTIENASLCPPSSPF